MAHLCANLLPFLLPARTAVIACLHRPLTLEALRRLASSSSSSLTPFAQRMAQGAFTYLDARLRVLQNICW